MSAIKRISRAAQALSIIRRDDVVELIIIGVLWILVLTAAVNTK